MKLSLIPIEQKMEKLFFHSFKKDEFYDINVTFAPSELDLINKTEFCVPSKTDGFSIIYEQKSRDIFTAKLIAGAWAEKIWKECILN